MLNMKRVVYSVQVGQDVDEVDGEPADTEDDNHGNEHPSLHKSIKSFTGAVGFSDQL